MTLPMHARLVAAFALVWLAQIAPSWTPAAWSQEEAAPKAEKRAAPGAKSAPHPGRA